MRKKPLVLIGLFLALLLGVIVGLPYYLDSQLSRATAILQIHPLPNVGSVQTGPRVDHFEEILSPDTLSLAIKSMQTGLPAKEDDINFLKTQLEVSPVHGTDFLNITAKHPSQEQAVQIANAVADAYTYRQVEVERQRTELAIKCLDEEIVLQLKGAHEQWLEFVIVCKQIGFDGPFFKDDPPKLQDMEKVDAHNQLKELGDEFNRTRITFLESNAKVDEMRLKQQEIRKTFKDPKTFVSIHEYAR